MNWQPSIFMPPPRAGRFLTLGLSPAADLAGVHQRLADLKLDGYVIVGLGEPLVRALGGAIDGLRSFPAVSGPGGAFPSTQGALWLSLGGQDPGEILHRTRRVLAHLGDAFRVDEDVASFVYGEGRDLSGFEDGTENPRDARAIEVAAAVGEPGLAGSSFVATQRWLHDLARFERLSPGERSQVIGRDLETNEELADAPPSAHVKRAAQESYDPVAFMLRRSMPWGDVREHGLYFVAYGATLDPFERVLKRMTGADDGIPDDLLRFSRPLTGGYFWCPPIDDNHLDLRVLKGRPSGQPHAA
jgi:putative iron-dependent peroxidase